VEAEVARPGGRNARQRPAGVNPFPLHDARHNLVLLAKELLLLEGHLTDPERRCPECVGKHLLGASALADEGARLPGGGPLAPVWSGVQAALGAVAAGRAGVWLCKVPDGCGGECDCPQGWSCPLVGDQCVTDPMTSGGRGQGGGGIPGLHLGCMRHQRGEMAKWCDNKCGNDEEAVYWCREAGGPWFKNPPLHCNEERWCQCYIECRQKQS
jgi:hypothetical protein